MKLSALIRAAGLPLAAGTDAAGSDPHVTGFAIDHRKVAPGTVFGAFMGSQVNGEDFIPAAIAAGAVAIVARPEARVAGALHIADPLPRRLFARLAAGFFTPVPRTVVAVTGTNSMPLMVELTKAQMLGADQDAFFAAINKDVQKSVSPQRTTTTGSHYRRLSIAAVAERLARELCLG